MIGWSQVVRAAHVANAGPCAVRIACDEFVSRQERGRRILSLAGNLLVALLFGHFLYLSTRFFLQTGSLVGVGLVIFNSMAVACLLTRRRPRGVTGSIRNWILAPLTVYMPFLLRPIGSTSWLAIMVSTGGQILGLSIMIVSLLALNRSVGIVAANRGLVTHGPYAWVRHPLYAGELTFSLGFLASNWSHLNAVIMLALVLAQVARSYQEEVLLVRDERYAVYRTVVPYRLIPGIF